VDTVIGTLRWIHIGAGLLALGVAPGAMLTAKGGRFYSAFTGYRVLSRKRPDRGDRARSLDWAAALFTLGASASLILLGLFPPGPAWAPRASVAVVFGAIGIVLAARDIWQFVRPPADPLHWWFHHTTGMLTSYIAAVTTFSVVNFAFLPRRCAGSGRRSSARC
jgi:predicted small integral membrane protein